MNLEYQSGGDVQFLTTITKPFTNLIVKVSGVARCVVEGQVDDEITISPY